MERSGDLRPLTYYHFQPFWTGDQHKKEMLVDGQTHLVLIREEAGAPDAKVRIEEEGRQAGWGDPGWLGSALAEGVGSASPGLPGTSIQRSRLV